MPQANLCIVNAFYLDKLGSWNAIIWRVEPGDNDFPDVIILIKQQSYHAALFYIQLSIFWEILFKKPRNSPTQEETSLSFYYVSNSTS